MTATNGTIIITSAFANGSEKEKNAIMASRKTIGKKDADSMRLNVATAGSQRMTLWIPRNKQMCDLMQAVDSFMDIHCEDMELRVDGFVLPRTGSILEAGIADGDCVLVYRKFIKPTD